MKGLRGSLGAGKEGGKQENGIALTWWRWCPVRRGGGCCREHVAPWEAKMAVIPPLLIPEPSLQAAVGLRHNLTHGEKGGAGEQGVHVQAGFQLWTNLSWSLTAVPCVGLGA